MEKGKQKLIENQIEEANIIARVLLQFVLALNRTELLMNQEQKVEEEKRQEYEKAIQKIIEGIPMQYITHKQEFYGIPFYVDENVLIPQPDTEILVEEVVSLAKNQQEDILDIGTGSGAIGIALASNITSANITISDISKKALEIAKKNAIENKVIQKIKLVQSNLFENIEGTFSIIVSNPPYIETEIIKELPKQVQNEPILALDGGKDGLTFYRKLVEEAPNYLRQGGYLCMEIGYNQKEAVLELLQNSPRYQHTYSKKDLSGNDRIIIAQKWDNQ